MAQGILSYKYEPATTGLGFTAHAGLPAYLDLFVRLGLTDSIERHLDLRDQGYTATQMVAALILLNLAGGESMNDLGVLEADPGFSSVAKQLFSDKRLGHQPGTKRWRKPCQRGLPGASSVARFLDTFHDPEQELLRVPKKAFIPASNAALVGLWKVNRDLVAAAQHFLLQDVATLDMDATLVQTSKGSALYSYKGSPAYQPHNIWWAEQDLMLHSEFRDGNVGAGYEQLRMLTEGLESLPKGVLTARVRSDTAGYQHDLLRSMEMGANPRFGRIEFVIGCDVTPEFRRAVKAVAPSEWKPVTKKVNGKSEPTGSEWAHVPLFVPAAIARKKSDPDYRYLATRELLKHLPTETQLTLPFQTVEFEGRTYKVFGTVTNMKWEGNKLLNWQRERCGKSEEAHSVLKEDLAGGRLPSGKFGCNAAWWAITILAMNLNTLMKRLALGNDWLLRRMKALRYSLINVPGQVMRHAGELLVRLPPLHPAALLLPRARDKIAALPAFRSG